MVGGKLPVQKEKGGRKDAVGRESFPGLEVGSRVQTVHCEPVFA